jgi:predicted transcriptional regulator
VPRNCQSGAAETARVVRRRYDCLRAIVTEPREKRALVEATETPRSTLDDIVRELESTGLVTYDDGVWRPTTSGRVAAEVHADYRETVRDLEAAAPVVDSLPHDTPLDREFLEGATVHEAEQALPDAVVTSILESVADAERVCGFAPTAFVGFADRFRDEVTDGGGELELVLSPDLFDLLTGHAVGEETAETATVLAGEIPVEFGLWIADDTEAGVVVYAGQGIEGVVINDSPEAVAWAESLYERVSETATPAELAPA